jgi:hypothetical protein
VPVFFRARSQCRRVPGRLLARRQATAVPAARTEPLLLCQVTLDLLAKPDRSAAQVGYRLGEARVLLSSKRQGGPPDTGKLCGLGQPDQIEAQLRRSLFGRFGRNPARPSLFAGHKIEVVVRRDLAEAPPPKNRPTPGPSATAVPPIVTQPRPARNECEVGPDAIQCDSGGRVGPPTSPVATLRA